MHALGEYIVSVSAAAFLWAILSSLMPKGPSKEILKLVAGLFLAFTVIRPVSEISLPELSELGRLWQEEGKAASAQGKEMAEKVSREYIKQALEAYILDKAQALGLSLRVQVELRDEDNLPRRTILYGSAAPLSREKLTAYMTETLGLPEEDILWTGPD